MRLYEIKYSHTGEDAHKRGFNLHGLFLYANKPKYLFEDELPADMGILAQCPSVKITEVTIPEKTPPDRKIQKAKAAGLEGIVWKGTAQYRHNQYGMFRKNEPNFELSKEIVEYMSTLPGFEKI